METIPQILEDAWEHAYPGREAAERNSARREAVGPAARRDSVSIGLSFQCLTGSVILRRNPTGCRRRLGIFRFGSAPIGPTPPSSTERGSRRLSAVSKVERMIDGPEGVHIRPRANDIRTKACHHPGRPAPTILELV